MALIAWPADISLRSVQWQQIWPRLVQRSEFTGRRRLAAFGACARWSAECELPPLPPTKVDALRAFFARLATPGNFTRLVAVETPQAPGVAGVSSGVGTSALTLGITGLAASVTVLRAGQMISVPLSGGDCQLLVLSADLVSDATGFAVASFEVPFRAPVVLGAVVELNLPFAQVEAGADILTWAAAPGRVYSAAAFTLTEAF